MPIAREELARPDPSPYVNYAKKCLDDEVPTLYVVARDYNVPLAEWAVEEIEKKRFYKKQNEWKSKIPRRRGVEGYVAVLSKV